MPDLSSLVPEITDDDIDWVSKLMRLDRLDAPRRAFLTARTTIDVSACPGSGKTTLIVAKLAILARKWPHRTKGICVLSHTNVAREEIQRRLGSTVVGHRLLGYPHVSPHFHTMPKA
jgi:superfamily I DNA/RNA helicase